MQYPDIHAFLKYEGVILIHRPYLSHPFIPFFLISETNFGLFHDHPINTERKKQKQNTDTIAVTSHKENKVLAR